MGKKELEVLSESVTFEENFASLMASIQSLPTLSTIIWEVQATIKNRSNGSDEIAFVIEQDLSLTGNILRLANSAFFGRGVRYISVADAITRIGLREIERMVNSTLIIDTFSTMEDTMDYTEFWCHSIQVAEIVSFIADLNPEKITMMTSEVYMVGLLHDVGKLLLDQYFAPEFGEVRKYADIHECRDADAELELLGMEHGKMGAHLMEYWGLSSQMIETISFHHRVEACPEEFRADAELIRYGDELLYVYQQGELSEENLQHPLFNLKGLNVEKLGSIVEVARKKALELLM